MKIVQRIIKNFLLLSFGNIISKAILFVVTIYLARIFGPENFGKVAFAEAIVVYFTLIANLGLSTLGIREVARNRDKIANYVNNIFALRLILSGLSFSLLLLFVTLIYKSTETKYLIILYGFSLFPFALLSDWVFQGIERMEYVGISQVLDKLCFFILIFLFVKSSGQLLLIPCLWVVAGLFASGFLIYIYMKQFGRIRLNFNYSFWKDLLKQALPMGTAYIMTQIYFSFDTVMLGLVKTNEVVGWYNAPYKIIFFLLGVGSIFGLVIYPIITKYYKESLEKLQKIIWHASKITTFISIPIAVGGTILAKPMMNLFFGNQYNNGIIIFQILIWSIVTSYSNIPFGFLLLACDKQKKYMYSVTTGALVNVVLNLYLIPKYSLIGAAIAKMLTEIVVFLMLYIYAQEILKVRIKSFILRPLIISVPMGICIYFLGNSIFIKLILGLSVYLSLSLVTGGIKRGVYL